MSTFYYPKKKQLINNHMRKSVCVLGGGGRGALLGVGCWISVYVTVWICAPYVWAQQFSSKIVFEIEILDSYKCTSGFWLILIFHCSLKADILDWIYFNIFRKCDASFNTSAQTQTLANWTKSSTCSCPQRKKQQPLRWTGNASKMRPLEEKPLNIFIGAFLYLELCFLKFLVNPWEGYKFNVVYD